MSRKQVDKVGLADERLREYNKLLKKWFGYDGLKPEQFTVIDKLVHERRDVCVVLATGFGKSMCYQLPFLITGKSVLVVSPLVALMQDQKTNMEKLGIPVCSLNGANTEKGNDKDALLAGENRLIYITPEHLEKCRLFLKMLHERDGIGLCCVDEAHSCSTWADFRPSYARLNVLRDWLPGVPILTLTATATDKVRDDIVRVMKLEDPYFVTGSFDRSNLYIEVREKSKDIKADLESILKKHMGSRMIIYCKTIKETDKVQAVIEDIGIYCLSYNAGMSNVVRNGIQKQFTDGECNCIIATIAFGMGIDIPDIELVVHYGCPKNLEGYYQEVGRAGRNGKPADCIMLYSAQDFVVSRHFLDRIKDKAERDYQEQQIRTIESYVYSTDCRRKTVLAHFGDSGAASSCDKCDNCLKSKNGGLVMVSRDLTYQGKLLFETIMELSDNGRWSYGSSIIILILKGSKSARVRGSMKKLKHYGSGKQYSDQQWKKVIQLLKLDGYLVEKYITGKGMRMGGTVLECTQKARNWVKGTDKLVVQVKSNVNRIDAEPDTETEIETEMDNDKECDIVLGQDSENANANANNIAAGTARDVTKPEKHGAKWTKEEEDKLMNMMKNIDKKKGYMKEIAGAFKRSVGSIRSKVMGIAYEMHVRDGKSIEELEGLTAMTGDQLTKGFDWIAGSARGKSLSKSGKKKGPVSDDLRVELVEPVSDDLVDAALVPIVNNLHGKGVGVEDICDVTALSEDQVKKIIESGVDKSAKRKIVVKAKKKKVMPNKGKVDQDDD